MSINDNSGVTAARPAAAARDTSTRSGSGSARYQDVGLDPGAPGGSSSSDNPFDGATAGAESRPCALVIWWEEWQTQEDERTCPECAPLDKQWFEVGKGPSVPLHDNCRCRRVLVWWDCYQSDGTWEKGGRPQ